MNTTKLTKAQCLKRLKELNSYEKKYFVMTLADLRPILADLEGKEKVINDEKRRVQILEPVFEVEEEPYVKQTIYPKKKIAKVIEEVKKEPEVVVEKQKKLNKINKITKIVKVDDSYKKEVQTILKEFNDDVMDILTDFDDEIELSGENIETIRNEYDKYLTAVYDKIEEILEDKDEDLIYLKTIERKIKMVDTKVDKFLED